MNAPWFSALLVERLGWLLVHSVWQFAALALVAWLLDRVSKGGAATVRYGVLLVVLVAMPVSLLATLVSIASHEPRAGVESRLNPAGTDSPIVATDNEERRRAEESVTTREAATMPHREELADRGLGDEQRGSDAESRRATAAAWEAWCNNWERAVRPWLGWIVGLWSLGVLGFATRPVLGWRYVRRLRREGVSPVPHRVATCLERLATQLRLSQGVQLLQSSLVAAPVVVGYFRPLILVPVGLVTGLPVDQLEGILAHELAHIRRSDYLVNLVQSLIETVFFYHPAVWWLSGRVRAERENCCDDVAVVLLGNRVTYGRALLALEEMRGGARVLVLGARGGTLLARVQRILGPSSRPSAVRGGSLLAGSLVVVGLILGVVWTPSPAGDRPPRFSQDDPGLAGGTTWPQWGGSSRRNNVTAAKDMPVMWNVESGRNVAWKADLGSQTYSSPVVSGGRVLIGTNNQRGRIARYPAEQDLACLLCFDERTGAFQWQYSSEKLPTGRDEDWPGIGLCSTPCVIGDRVWLTTNRAEVVCLDLEGFRDDQNDGPVVDEPNTGADEADVVWRFDMRKVLGITPRYQSCSSVMVVGDLVLLNTSHSPEGSARQTPGDGAAIPSDTSKQPPSFLALDRHTGHVVWSDNSPGWNILGHECPSSSPSAGEIGGVWQAIFAGGDGWLYSFALAEMNRGKTDLLWKFDGNEKRAVHHVGGQSRRNIILASPVIHNQRVYVSMGQNPEHGEGPGQLWCLDPARRGDISPELVFNQADPERPIPHKRLQACVPEAGDFTRPNPNSGVVWQYEQADSNGDGKFAFEEAMHRCIGSVTVHNGLVVVADLSGLLTCLDVQTGRPYWTHDLLAACWSTPVVAEEEIYVADEDGEVEVLRLAAKKEVLATNSCGASIYGTPAMASGTIYVATNSQLLAVTNSEPPAVGGPDAEQGIRIPAADERDDAVKPEPPDIGERDKPMNPVTVCGLDVSRYPSTFDRGTLPGFLVPDPEKPGRKKWAANLLSMPIYKSNPYATLDYPVGAGHFFVTVREDQRTRTYGPIDGDPFELLGLDASMHALLRDAVEDPNDALLRLRQLLTRGDDELCRRGFSMVHELPVPGDRRMLNGLIEILESLVAQSTDAPFKIAAERALSRAKELKATSVASWESRRVRLEDSAYAAGKNGDPDPQIAWGQPHPESGLQVGFRLNPLPATRAKPDRDGFAWSFGDPLTATVYVRAQGDAPVKFTSTTRADEGLRFGMVDEAGRRFECGIGSFTSLLKETRLRLSKGEWVELKQLTFTATPRPAEFDETRFHGGFVVDPGQYSLHCALTIAGFESGGKTGPITVPAAGEWTGELISGDVPVKVEAEVDADTVAPEYR